MGLVTQLRRLREATATHFSRAVVNLLGTMLPVLLLFFALLGLVVTVFKLTALIWNLIQGLRAFVLPSLNDVPSVDLKTKFGSWAVVTGSTDGIGRAYAEELARRGINLVLISRSHDKLSVVASHFASQYKVEVRIITADFSLGPAIYEEIERQLGGVPVGILVNNVGCQYSYPMYVGEVPTNEIWSILNVNMGATVMMTKMILEGMRQRGHGAIVNISSGSELQPLPFMTVYAASKTFVKNFSAALRYEYSDDGITVQHLSPLFVNTKMNAFSYRLQKSSLFVPDAVTYARNAVNTLGIVNTSTGYWAHGIQYWCSEIPPEWMRTYIGGLLNKGFRRDYFKGQANRSMK